MIARCDWTGFRHVDFSVIPSARALKVGYFSFSGFDQDGTSDQCASSKRSSPAFAESSSTGML